MRSSIANYSPARFSPAVIDIVAIARLDIAPNEFFMAPWQGMAQ
jgi:hypothetical protein